MRRLLWSEQARLALFDAAAYHAQTDPGFAVDLLDRVEAAPTRLLEYPEIGSLMTGGARKWRVAHTPYIILYDVTDDTIEVTALHHVRSNYPR